MKKLIAIGIIILLVGVSVQSTGVNVEKSDTSYVDESYSELGTQLSKYGLETRDTIKDFEQTLYRLIYRGLWMNPFLSFRLKKDVAELSDILYEMGISDDMIIAEALPIIKENKGQLQDKGINLFCSIDIYSFSGGCWPYFRFFKVLYGSWKYGNNGHIEINSPITGLQYCKESDCSSRYGEFIGMMGTITHNPFTFPTIPEYNIDSKFTLYSKCDVPFVNSTSELQTPCPCEKLNQDDALKVSNVHEGVGGYVK